MRPLRAPPRTASEPPRRLVFGSSSVQDLSTDKSHSVDHQLQIIELAGMTPRGRGKIATAPTAASRVSARSAEHVVWSMCSIALPSGVSEGGAGGEVIR
jgi:hypothetical protein